LSLRIFLLASLAVGLAGAAPEHGSEGPALDYRFFRERVQPVLVKARCSGCHARTAPLLARLPRGEKTWNEEQSRRNFEAWKAVVVAGSPEESLALLKPLAGEAVPEHKGGKPWASMADPAWQTIAAWVRGRRVGGLAVPASGGADYAFQATEDGVYVIDAGTDEVVGLIGGLRSPRGVALSPDGRRVYVAEGASDALAVFDFATFEVLKRIPVGARPSSVTALPDGSQVYVATEGESVAVIDARALVRTTLIATDGPARHAESTPDGNFVLLSSPESELLSVIDVGRGGVSWTIRLDGGIGPMSFIRGGDGSTRSVLMQLEGVEGFAVLDFGTRAVTYEIQFPKGAGGPAAGFALSPDPVYPSELVLWASDPAGGAVVAHGVPITCSKWRKPKEGQRCEWERLRSVEIPGAPGALATSPDGKRVFAALGEADETAVIDAATMTVVERIAVGKAPAALATGVMTTR